MSSVVKSSTSPLFLGFRKKMFACYQKLAFIFSLLAVLLLIQAFTSAAAQAPYSPLALELTLYGDGTVNVKYEVSVEPTARVTVPLFGGSFEDPLVVNENNLLLDHSVQGSMLTVDTVGSTRATITYSTATLASRQGAVWTLSLHAPTNVTILLPVSAEILSVNAVPLETGRSASGETLLIMPQGSLEVSYTIAPATASAPSGSSAPAPSPTAPQPLVTQPPTNPQVQSTSTPSASTGPTATRQALQPAVDLTLPIALVVVVVVIVASVVLVSKKKRKPLQ